MAIASGTITLPHTCPKCGKRTATTWQDLEEKFGMRNMGNGRVRNQSWCKQCRSKSQ